MSDGSDLFLLALGAMALVCILELLYTLGGWMLIVYVIAFIVVLSLCIHNENDKNKRSDDAKFYDDIKTICICTFIWLMCFGADKNLL